MNEISISDNEYEIRNIRYIKNCYLMDGEQYLENLCTIIEDSVIKKVNKFEQTVMKNDKFNDPYELTKLIIHRHFLIKTFEEINQESKKDNRQIRIHFDDNAYKYFNYQNYNYFKKEGCIADNDALLYSKLREEIYPLDLAIKKNTNDKELKYMRKKIKSKLPVCKIALVLRN